MKKTWTVLLALVLALSFSSALAVVEGEYVWEDWSVFVTGIDLSPMFAPAGMAEGERPVSVTIWVPADILTDDEVSGRLYDQAMLEDEDGALYAAGAATQKGSDLTYYYAIPQDQEVDALTLTFIDPLALLLPYVGHWAGSVDDISLDFVVNEDGTGMYTFEQGGYQESYEFVMTAASETFTVTVPEGNASGIAACEGTYVYEDGVLTLDVVTTFVGGREFSYTVPCERVEG